MFVRRDLVAGALLAACVPPLSPAAWAAAPQSFTTVPIDGPVLVVPKVTDKCFLDIRIIQRYDVEVLEDAATRGRFELELYGDAAPMGVTKFLEFIDGTPGQFKTTGGGGPAYSSGSFDKLRPGVLLEGGRIAGLRQTEFAGSTEYEYLGRLLPLRPVIEVSDPRHDRRGLLTRSIFAIGPEFGITLGPAPALDGTHEVIGRLAPGSANDALLTMLEGLPYITGRSLDGEGTAADAIFTAQKSFFPGLAKASGDTRAEDRTGQLLRRVEITKCGRL
jgi:cyclophilin family peptidyl-prolyl cis-trans isomerase